MFAVLVYQVASRPVVLKGEVSDFTRTFLQIIRVAAYGGLLVVGPLSAVLYSYRYRISNGRVEGSRWFGFSRLSFQRQDIASAHLQQKTGRRILRIVLRCGKTLVVHSYGSNFDRLARFAGAAERQQS